MDFHSERFSYRNFEEKDEDFYVQISTHPVLMKYITGEPVSDAAAKARFQKVLAINNDATQSGVHIVFHKESQEYAGLSKFVFSKPGQAEIGYVLREKFWGQQMGTEISQRMVELTKVIDGVEELIALIDPENMASKRILEKCGFEFKENGDYEGLPSATYHLMIND